MKEKIVTHPAFGEIHLIKKRGVRRITIRISASRQIRVTLPWLVPFAAGELFLRQSEEKITKILSRQGAKMEKREPVSLPHDPIALRAIIKDARAALTTRTHELAALHGFTHSDGTPLFGRIAIKNNKSNWGSCSAKGNINLNIRLHFLPPPLRDYVILHELCHLRHLNHGQEFHHLLETVCSSHYKGEKSPGIAGELRKKLKSYTIV